MRKRFYCLLAVVLILSLVGCQAGEQKNNTDYSGLTMPKELDFQFNTRSFNESGTAGSHDPCVMKDPKSGTYYSYSTDNSFDNTKPGKGVQIRKSTDLEHWTYVGVALSEKAIIEAQDNGEGNAPTGTFWAPDAKYVDGEYRLYYAATKAFGSSESRIWLATSKNPEGPFENRGVVVSSWIDDDNPGGPNAIDPDIVIAQDGKSYMSYGSFFEGIYLKELGKDGLALNKNRSSTDYYGICIANKGDSSIDGPEGSSILYNKDTGYYYLFLSYGWLGDTYDIRVGRSKSVTGPYEDYGGNKMNDAVSGVTTGTKLACSYKFSATKPGGVQKNVDSDWKWAGFRAPGHGVPFLDDNGSYYFIHHIRDGAEINHSDSNGQSTYFMHYLMVRSMAFVNGWPVLSPEQYAGETQQPIASSYLVGNWETISFTNDSNDQKIAGNTVLSKLNEKGEGIASYASTAGTWTYQADQNQITIKLQGGNTITAKVLKCWDLENSKASICFTGLDSNGIAQWGKYK